MSTQRRIPAQSRSREKYEQVIETAKELIGSKGNDSVSMREISKHSGVALASIYQYFPDKNAILHAIMTAFFDDVREQIISQITDCNTLEELGEQLVASVDVFYQIFKEEPVIATLWAGLQANPKLVELDAEDSKTNAAIICEKVCTLVNVGDQDKMFDAILLLVHMIGTSVRLALVLPGEEGERLVEAFKELALMRINSLKAS